MSSFEERQQLRFADPGTGLTIDLSGIGLTRPELESWQQRFGAAAAEMQELEAGAVANPDEGRQVGHYWLRAPELAPDGVEKEITRTHDAVLDFARSVREARVFPPRGGRYEALLLIGIGGSALGPQLLADALADGGLRLESLDNTDPDGIRRVLRGLDLAETLFVVISKSGGTKETRNGMLEARAAATAEGLDFARQAVAVTGVGSALHELAEREGWLATFPMWDWVGGRTSVTSAVGLLPAALCGIDVEAFLAGARQMDERTRGGVLLANPAGLLAVAWHAATGGKGERDMVVLPYRDRLLLFSRYLQQLLMESLGKELDRSGQRVQQGLAVYGNKGSTDQHAFVQQLRDGLDNFFVCFIRVLDDGDVSGLEVEPGVTSGDYLHGFWLGTRAALREKGRRTMTLTLQRLDAASLGALIALFERAVGLYASLIDINAYHQPGVEAGKRAAGAALALQARMLEALGTEPRRFEDLTRDFGADERDTAWHVLERLAANSDRTGVRWTDAGISRTSPLS